MIIEDVFIENEQNDEDSIIRNTDSENLNGNVIAGNDAPYQSNPDDTEHVGEVIEFGD